MVVSLVAYFFWLTLYSFFLVSMNNFQDNNWEKMLINVNAYFFLQKQQGSSVLAAIG